MDKMKVLLDVDGVMLLKSSHGGPVFGEKLSSDFSDFVYRKTHLFMQIYIDPLTDQSP
jgi:hypothetical protein